VKKLIFKHTVSNTQASSLVSHRQIADQIVLKQLNLYIMQSGVDALVTVLYNYPAHALIFSEVIKVFHLFVWDFVFVLIF
jgi:hypothetical protein